MGSGKTALVSLLPRLYDVSTGSVQIDGADVRTVDLVSLRQSIAVVNDDPFLFSATVHDNIAYARARRHARGSGARRRWQPRRTTSSSRLPKGYDTMIGERGSDALRRAAPAHRDRARDRGRPADPDPRRRHVLGRRLHRAGDQACAARGDGGPHHLRDRPPPVDDRARRRIFVLEDGRLADQGSHDELLQSSDLYREIVEKGMPDQVFLNRKPLEAEGLMSVSTSRGGCHGAAPPAARDRRAWAQAPRAVRCCSPPTGGACWRCSSHSCWRTAAALAPAPLAKVAIDQGIQRHDTGALDMVVAAFLVSAVIYADRHLRADLPGRLGRPARPAGPAGAAVQAPAVAVDRLLLAQPGRRDHLPDHQRRRGPRSARRGRSGHADPVRADAARRRGDPDRARLPAGAADVSGAAAARAGRARLPDRVGRRLPADPREDRQRSPATCRRPCPGSEWSARSDRSRDISGASGSSTTRTAPPT